jgi:hypothetical protein
MRSNVKTLWCSLAMIIAMASPAVAAPDNGPPRLLTSSLERCVTAQLCTRKLESMGGLPPLRWYVDQKQLPPGLTLQSDGTISGIPTTPGTFHFTVEVGDATRPPRKDSRELMLVVVPAMPMDWRQPPACRETTIAGTLWVTNNTPDDFVLTVIVVAVNEYGKAFTLGYQHFTLSAGTTSPDIPFQMQMPRGRYRVRADAVGELMAKKQILRTNKEAGPFQVQ